MGQEDILKVLSDSKEPLSVREIAKRLNVPSIKLFPQIKKLVRYNEIAYIELDRFKAMEKYRGEFQINRKLCLYYVVKD